MKPKWVVHTKGGPCEAPFEICVIRVDTEHGKLSYGWFDENKLLISHSGGPCRDTVTKKVWNKLITLAHEVANELNKELI